MFFCRSTTKEQALKEIRCLAILNHPNLIRYYYAWHECPPDGWQDEIDEKLMTTNNDLTKYYCFIHKNHLFLIICIS